jgi:HSP20 family protein
MMLVPRTRGMVPFRSALDDFFDADTWRPHMGRSGYPKVDIHETDKDVVATADIPGIDPKNINIDVNDDMFTISGKIEEEKEEKDKKCLYQERFFGEFSRSFSLPTRVDSEHVTAKFKNGTLSVHMPKMSATKTKKVNIEIEK